MSATRIYGLTLSLLMLAMVAWPLGLDPLRDDSFPLSTYPMFAIPRKDAQLYLEYVVATGPEVARRHVPPELVASREVMQAITTVHAAVARGDGPRLCRQVAARLAGRASYRRYDTVHIIAGNHRAIAYLVHGVHGTERVVASCPLREAPR